MHLRFDGSVPPPQCDPARNMTPAPHDHAVGEGPDLPEPNLKGPVLFDGAILDRGPWTGVAQAFLHGLRAYATKAHQPPLLLLANGATDPEIPGVEVLRGPTDALRRGSTLRGILRERGCAVLHSPVTSLPRGLTAGAIATVHDLPWCHPEVPGEGPHRRARAALRRALRYAARNLARIVVPSEFTRGDVLGEAGRLGGRDPALVVTLPHGIALPQESIDPGPVGEHILVIATDRPRKNLPRLQAAHGLALRQAPGLPPLRVLGADGYVSEAEKHQHIRSAELVVVPSLLEGFGLPVLEAMGHGVPVLAAEQPALREVAGDAALLADPTDTSSLAEGMLRLHRDRTLRRELAQRGRRRAQEFTPAPVAEGWLQLHREVAGGRVTNDALPKGAPPHRSVR